MGKFMIACSIRDLSRMIFLFESELVVKILACPTQAWELPGCYLVTSVYRLFYLAQSLSHRHSASKMPFKRVY